MRDRLTVVHGPMPCLSIIPVTNVHRSDLKIEPRRDAVHRAHLDKVFVGVVRVHVCVDEARRDHLAGGVDRLSAFDLRRRDRGNNSVFDFDICDLVELGLLLHNPTLQDDGGVPVCGEMRAHGVIRSIRGFPSQRSVT